MDGYYSTIFEENRGAILMAVCRGRISEGLDFSDKAARAVIVVGIPFAQLNDPKIVLKKDYLDLKYKRSCSYVLAIGGKVAPLPNDGVVEKLVD